MDFLRGEPIFGEKTGNRNRNEPEPVEPNRGFKDLGMNRTEPIRGLPVTMILMMIRMMRLMMILMMVGAGTCILGDLASPPRKET